MPEHTPGGDSCPGCEAELANRAGELNDHLGFFLAGFEPEVVLTALVPLLVEVGDDMGLSQDDMIQVMRQAWEKYSNQSTVKDMSNVS